MQKTSLSAIAAFGLATAVTCPPPVDRTPHGYMTCEELNQVVPVAMRDPDIAFICADIVDACSGLRARCAPGRTTVVRGFGEGPALAGCVETGTYACDDQAHVDCCSW